MAIPENPTLIERFVELIPLPYGWAALVWTAILGTPGGFLLGYIDTGSIVIPATLASLYNNLSLVITLFYLFYVSRYVRLGITRAEPHITPIISAGGKEYHSVFGRIGDPRPVIILTLIFLTLETLATLPIVPDLTTGLLFAQYFAIALGLGSFVWEYSISNWGLHQIGKSQLKLRSFLEDRMMGTRPFGNAALSSTVAYMGGLLFAFLLGNSNPRINSPSFYAFAAVLFVLGIVMFFLPLNSIHSKMQLEKSKHQRALGQKLLTLDASNVIESDNGPASIEKVERGVVQLVRLKELEITERKLANTPTWPFDVQLLAKLVTITLSVTAVLLTRLITDYLIRI